MDKDELREVLREHANWLCGYKREGVRANLRNADLRGANLEGAFLELAIFSGADLRGADLTGADYIEGSLEVAKL